jgi:hypothetical protein
MIHAVDDVAVLVMDDDDDVVTYGNWMTNVGSFDLRRK